MKGFRESFQQGVGIGVGGSWFADSKSSCCRMENNEQAPLEVEVPEIPENPESPQPSPRSPSPVFVIPEGDASTFMDFYSLDDLVDLEEWARRSRELRGTPDYVMVEPGISDNLRLFLRYTEGAQWQYKLIHHSGEVLLFQLRAYLKGFELLTPFNRRQWVRLFSAWTLSERREQLELLANSGGFIIM